MMTRVTITIEPESKKRMEVQDDKLITRDGDGTATEDENGDIKPPGEGIPDKTVDI